MERYAALRAPAALGMGIFCAFLFYGKPPGISFPIIVWTTLLSCAAWGLAQGRRLERAQTEAGLAAMAFSALFSLRCAPGLALADLGWATYLSALFLVPWLQGKPLSEFYTRDFGRRPPALLRAALFAGVRELERWLRGRLGAASVPWGGLASGALLALPALGILLHLMRRADQIFDALVGRGIAGSSALADGFLPRALLAAAASALFAGLYAGLAPAKEQPEQAQAGWLSVLPPRAPNLSFAAGATVGWLVNALLASFAAVQGLFLFGGKQAIEALGVGYAAYAMRGFCQMIEIAVFSLILTVVLDQETARETPRQRQLHKANLVLLGGLAAVTMSSAFYRLALYVQAYGLTQLRFYAQTFTAYWAAVFAILTLKVLREQAETAFLRRLFLATLALFLGWNLANPDLRIAKTSVRRHLSGRSLMEPAAMRVLSDDALPALAEAAPSLDPAAQDWVLRFLAEREGFLREPVPWPSAHLGRRRALRALTVLEDGPLAAAWERERGWVALARVLRLDGLHPTHEEGFAPAATLLAKMAAGDPEGAQGWKEAVRRLRREPAIASGVAAALRELAREEGSAAVLAALGPAPDETPPPTNPGPLPALAPRPLLPGLPRPAP